MKSFEEMCKTGEIYENEEQKNEIMNKSEVEREIFLHEIYNQRKSKEINQFLKELKENKSSKAEDTNDKAIPIFSESDFIITRDLLLPNIFKPFANILKGCFVRVYINRKYSICKITGFCKIPVYELCDKLKTNCSIALTLDTGSKLIDGLQINSVSSTRPSIEELKDFLKTFGIKDVNEIKKKCENVKSEFSRSMKDFEITKTIEAKQKDNPKKKTNTQRKIEIIAKRDEAIQVKNKAEAIRLQSQLEKIEDEERRERKERMEEESNMKKRPCL